MSLVRSAEYDTIPCSVSEEFLQFVANLNPEAFIINGKIDVPKVLFSIGFKIDFDRPDVGYYVIPDRIIRSKARPYMTYTTTVYNGNVRQELKEWRTDPLTGKGTPVYDKHNAHFMKSAYAEVEVLTLDTFDPTLLVNIEEIGDSRIYAEGMANLDKRINVDKVFRNVVR